MDLLAVSRYKMLKEIQNDESVYAIINSLFSQLIVKVIIIFWSRAYKPAKQF